MASPFGDTCATNAYGYQTQDMEISPCYNKRTCSTPLLTQTPLSNGGTYFFSVALSSTPNLHFFIAVCYRFAVALAGDASVYWSGMASPSRAGPCMCSCSKFPVGDLFGYANFSAEPLQGKAEPCCVSIASHVGHVLATPKPGHASHALACFECMRL